MPADDTNRGSARQPRILLVDDDVGLLGLMSRRLARESYATEQVASARELREWLTGHEADLILLDYNLPDRAGREVVADLKETHPGVKFIVITGQGDERLAVEMMKCGAIDYIVKDAQFLDLLPSVVERALRGIENETRLAQAEEELRREHALNLAILDTTAALVVVLDLEGRVIRFNPACEALTGFSSAELRGKPMAPAVMAPKEARAFSKMLQAILKEGKPVTQQLHWTTRDRRECLITWSMASIAGPQGGAEYILGTGIDLTERKRLEEEILAISEREQQRIGHDLHDGLCQMLASIELMGQVLEQNLVRVSRDEASRAGRITENVREAIRQTRMLARGLSPVMLEERGLSVALQELASSTKKLFHVQCVFEQDADCVVQQISHATHLYRIVQEAINNALKHGRARSIQIRLRNLDEKVAELTVLDDGVGVKKTTGSPQGMGLRIMRFRADMIGGELEVRSHPSGGTIVHCLFSRKL